MTQLRAFGLSLMVLLGSSAAAYAAASAPTQPSTQPAIANLPPPTRLTHVVHAYANFAPDEKTVVFQSNATGNWDLYTMRGDGTGVRQITTDRAADITPVFSPDGQRIAFVSERDGNREVYLCKRDGSEATRLTNDPGHDIHPFWSADGNRILFSSNRGNANAEDYDIYEMNADGTGVKRVTSGPDVDTYASWSPDGKRIVTRRVIDGTNNEVYVLNADGSSPVNLTPDAARYDGWPVWSPDGKRIAFASGVPGQQNHAIFLIDPDGTNKVQLTQPVPGWGDFMYNTQPAFAHDGKRMIYTMYKPAQREVSDLVIIELPTQT